MSLLQGLLGFADSLPPNAQQIFNRHDTNQDLSIDEKQFAKLFEDPDFKKHVALSTSQPATASQIFNAIDINKDKKITLDQFKAFIEKNPLKK